MLRSRVFRIRLFGQDSLVGVWAGMVIMGDTPSWSQVKAIRAPTSRAMFLTDILKDVAAVIAPEAGPAPNVVGRQTGLPGPAHP